MQVCQISCAQFIVEIQLLTREETRTCIKQIPCKVIFKRWYLALFKDCVSFDCCLSILCNSRIPFHSLETLVFRALLHFSFISTSVFCPLSECSLVENNITVSPKFQHCPKLDYYVSTSYTQASLSSIVMVVVMDTFKFLFLSISTLGSCTPQAFLPIDCDVSILDTLRILFLRIDVLVPRAFFEFRFFHCYVSTWRARRKSLSFD